MKTLSILLLLSGLCSLSFAQEQTVEDVVAGHQYLVRTRLIRQEHQSMLKTTALKQRLLSVGFVDPQNPGPFKDTMRCYYYQALQNYITPSLLNSYLSDHLFFPNGQAFPLSELWGTRRLFHYADSIQSQIWGDATTINYHAFYYDQNSQLVKDRWKNYFGNWYSNIYYHPTGELWQVITYRFGINGQWTWDRRTYCEYSNGRLRCDSTVLPGGTALLGYYGYAGADLTLIAMVGKNGSSLDTITKYSYTYDIQGRLRTATMYTKPSFQPGPPPPVSRDSIAYEGSTSVVKYHQEQSWNAQLNQWGVVSARRYLFGSSGLRDTVIHYNGSAEQYKEVIIYNSYSNPVTRRTYDYNTAALVSGINYYYEEYEPLDMETPEVADLTISVSPNPARTTVRISAPVEMGTERNVEVFDLAGRKVDGFSFRRDLIVDIRNYSPGLYLLHFKIGSKTKTMKLLKQ